MTEREKYLADLRSYAMHSSVVIAWLVDTLAPPLPEHIQRHLTKIGWSIEELRGADAEIVGKDK